MKRQRGFRPSDLDRLESRVVLSQTYFSPPTGVLVHGKVVKSVPAPPVGSTVRTVSRVISAEDGARTVDLSTSSDGTTFTNSTKVIHNANGTRQTEQATGTISGYSTTFTKAITLASGARQTETGTDVTVASVGTIAADGTVGAGPGPSGVIRTTTFRHVTTQPGLGTETTTGTTVYGYRGKNRPVTATDQQVTHFDGSTASVHILTTGTGASSTTQTTTTPAGGIPTVTTSSSRLLSTRYS